MGVNVPAGRVQGAAGAFDRSSIWESAGRKPRRQVVGVAGDPMADGFHLWSVSFQIGDEVADDPVNPGCAIA